VVSRKKLALLKRLLLIIERGKQAFDDIKKKKKMKKMVIDYISYGILSNFIIFSNAL